MFSFILGYEYREKILNLWLSREIIKQVQSISGEENATAAHLNSGSDFSFLFKSYKIDYIT